ncbi:transposase [Parafrankia colletiae]|uniref:Transposase n=1 Tax=Parafrankia colletiae TaxID=573497 RepID=A0A1S1RJR6_9ACTN|nr:IS110 family transposase [Parafrankia colletiae]MCK9899775.1 IS110 family transposase [Frankia sp. Cpl3]OHV46346.1 transposase [Parafrankia colletiae]
MAQQRQAVDVVGGVDTHRDTHTAAVLDTAGCQLGLAEFPATEAGYGQLLEWMRGFGTVVKVGVEGTGSYGANLTRHLTAAGVMVVEIDRPDRKTRRWQGKSDPVDADAAARAALAGRRTGIPKDRDGQVEAVRALRVARRGAVSHRADVVKQMKALIVTAPEPVRAALSALTTARLIAVCAEVEVSAVQAGDPAVAVRLALRSLARRFQYLSSEIKDLEKVLSRLVAMVAPTLLAVNGVGADTAGQLLVSAGDNPDRLRSEAAFAMLCGVAPLPASSGRTHRYRLNRGGDRQANAALHRVVVCRLRWDPATQAYVERRTAEGKTKKEIIRCLKRYVAREIYPILTAPDTAKDLPVAA